MDDFWNEVIDDYVVECSELLEDMEHRLLSSDKLDLDLANEMFRPLHSFKGSSASIGFQHLADVIHTAENLLTFFHNGLYSSDDPKYVSFFLKFSDFMKESFEKVQAEKKDESCIAPGKEIAEEATALADEISKILSGEGSAVEIACEEVSDEEACEEEVNEPLTECILFDDDIPSSQEDVETSDQEEVDAPVEIALNESEVKEKQEKKKSNGVVSDLDLELVAAFSQEAIEGFSDIEARLLALGKNPNDTESLREVFRQVHSFKGNCGIFSFADMEELGHRIESILDLVLQNKIEATTNLFSALLPLIDVLCSQVKTVVDGGPPDIDGLELYLEIIDGFSVASTEEKESVRSLEVEPIVEESAKPAQSIEEKEKKDEATPAPKKAASPSAPPSEKGGGIKRQDIRVDLRKLDSLNNLVGELVTVKTMVHEHFKAMQNIDQADKTFRLLDRITTDLQDVSMSIRMVPVVGLFKKMVRIVHDISNKVDKKISFEFYGEDTEIDKTIIEKISDPLVHMIRNAVDHGIEGAEDRSLAGKPGAGQVTLEAKNEGGEIWIILKDDGKGIDRNAILQKAISNGLIEGDGSDLLDNDVFNMIFTPGFSTAAQVTDVSGRGVGMDVVKKNIEEVNGRVDISSKVGEGTTFIIKIPLTLAIIQGMMFSVGNTMFALPIEAVKESVRIDEATISRPMNEQELVNIRGEMIPILRLSNLFGIPNKSDEGILLIVEDKGITIAILVDQLVGQRETVVKPIPNLFGNLKGISGCSILGDGGMSLILDVGSVIELSMTKKVRSHYEERIVEKDGFERPGVQQVEISGF